MLINASEQFLSKFRKHKNKVIIIVTTLVVLDFLVWWQIFGLEEAHRDLEIYFLDVGQGDSGLVALPGGVEILIDGGPPNGKVLNELDRVLERGDRYIDLVILSHPQLDHFGGLIEVLKRYEVGAFLHNGLTGKTSAFSELEKALQKKNIQSVILTKDDVIRYKDSRIKVLSPTAELLGKKDIDINDTSLVLELKSKNSKTLFTGDISAAVESNLLAYDVDILKVAHHGSKFSSSANFLKAVSPEVAVIGVGKNSYGHPTPQTLERLKGVGAEILRTDLDGTVKFVIDGEYIRIFKGFVQKSKPTGE